MSVEIQIKKRDGRTEPLDLDKIHKVLMWACEGLKGVSVSLIEVRAHIQFTSGITTADIHKTLIKSAADLISEESPDYQYVAARLAMFSLRKRAYGRFTPPSLYDQVVKMVELGKYDKHILEDYSKEELDFLNAELMHERDLDFSYAAVKQLEGKYLVQNRVSGEMFETPQFLYMLVAACLFSKWDKKDRIRKVVKFYHATSKFKISLPTPIMSGVRTPTRQFSSCVLIESGDSLDSINAAASSIVRYVSQRAGIGLNAGAIRALGSEIRGGEAFHTGCIPFYKYFQTAVKCCSQGGVRGGAATVFYPIWHLEVESLLVLKNNRGVEENRVRHMDYGVQLSKLFYERLTKGGHITLFSPGDVPDLYQAFFADQKQFEKLYLQYERDPAIRKEIIPAIELFSAMMQERSSTGRIYIQNVDHCNVHSAFNPELAPVRQSNLCMEITLPTVPLNSVEDEDGEIALCTLSAFNLGAITDEDDFEELAELVVFALDSLLDYQDYPIKAAYNSTMKRRSLGVGVINFAYYLAKNGKKYSDGSANEITHELFERIQYYLLKASMELAKIKGACSAFGDTQYAQGKLPIDTYKRDVDDLVAPVYKQDWDALRRDILKYGLRNSTLTALMPSETSSQISNATNGIEPPRGIVSIKQSKDGVLKQVVPEIDKYRDNYELLWQMPNNRGYLELVGIMQKFVDQSISANTNYDPEKFEKGKVPMKVLLGDLLTAYKFGVKTLYYHNTKDGADDAGQRGEIIVKEDEDCEGGGCKI
ncbi:class 1a ribonucleoside-diphosphate reductase subunit alpha [Vibrio owensii]|uniref:class 1a ribonucleoside-diphosphate reductase subunit alpha n=1 Tax=Vibrio owensii TaxID=696485 RepID=UPI0018F19336|nr:class 1a ribonucleoside-diphosphate reductase subunit alpha [Vibrio owensii]